MQVTNFLSKKISHLMCLFTLMVVYIHYSSSYIENVSQKFSHYIIYFFGQCLPRNAVPCFFLISGILTYYKIKAEDQLIKGRPRKLSSLVVPYIIWDTIAMIFYICLSRINNTVIDGNIISIVADGILLHKFLGPFWYILYLIMLSILSPLIFKVMTIKKLGALLIMIMVFLHLNRILTTGVLYYFIGAYCAIYQKELISSKRSNRTILSFLILFVVINVIRMYNLDITEDYVTARASFSSLMYELIAPACFWIVMDLVPFDRINVLELERHTFIVYAAHYMMVSLLTSTLIESKIGIPSTNSLWTLIVFFVLPIFIFFFLVLLSNLLKRKYLTIYSILTGGR